MAKNGVIQLKFFQLLTFFYRSSLFFFVLGKNREEKDEGRGKRNERGEKEGEEWKSSLLFFLRENLFSTGSDF